MAIYRITLLHEISTPSYFPQCIYELWSLASTYVSSNIADRKKPWALLNSWWNLRLVCQSWAAIINPRHTPSILIKNHTHLRGLFDVQTLGICDQIGWDIFSVKSPYHKDLLLTASTITTVTIYKGHRPMSGFMDYLISNLQSFPNLRSLSIETCPSLDHRFWSGLEIGYPDLIFLAIGGCARSSDAATLSKLETLVLCVEYPWSTLTLPSLKHFIIFIIFSNLIRLDFIKRQHAIGLESLVVWTLSGLLFNLSDTTILFPNLRMFGTNMSCFKKMQNTSLAHTAESQRCVSFPEHLWLTPEMSASATNKVINRLEGVNRLTLRLNSSFPYSTYLLRHKCRNNNIELVDASQWLSL
jgi:hypothetical protein